MLTSLSVQNWNICNLKKKNENFNDLEVVRFIYEIDIVRPSSGLFGLSCNNLTLERSRDELNIYNSPLKVSIISLFVSLLINVIIYFPIFRFVTLQRPFSRASMKYIGRLYTWRGGGGRGGYGTDNWYKKIVTVQLKLIRAKSHR